MLQEQPNADHLPPIAAVSNSIVRSRLSSMNCGASLGSYSAASQLTIRGSPRPSSASSTLGCLRGRSSPGTIRDISSLLLRR